MEAHIRYAPSVAPVLEGLVKAGLIEVLENKHPSKNLSKEEIAARMAQLEKARGVLSKNPNFYEEWKRDIDKMREEWD
jgi:hypothetical protein